MPLLNRLKLAATPPGLTKTQRQNFFYCQMDALAMGIAMGVNPFLSVFLTRLGATNFQVGLLSSMTGFTGLFFTMIIGRFLQTRRSIVPWYSWARFIRIVAFAVTGLLSVFLPPETAVIAILVLWLVASLPQALLSVAFSVLMNAIAGPKGRYALMSRRWAIIGIVSAAMVALAGQILDRVRFPLNYQITFVSFAIVSMIISRIFTQRYIVPSQTPPALRKPGQPLREQLRSFASLILAERPFVTITIKRIVFIFGSQLVMPLFSLYYVRELDATDAQISLISTVQRAILLVGYVFWPRLRDKRGSRFVLLCTTFAVALYPALTALNHSVSIMVVLAGIASVFSSGLNLVFFDELMKTVPPERSATFVAVTQSLQHFVVIIGPMISTTLADYIGLSGALLLGAAVRLIGFGLFLLGKHK